MARETVTGYYRHAYTGTYNWTTNPVNCCNGVLTDYTSTTVDGDVNMALFNNAGFDAYYNPAANSYSEYSIHGTNYGCQTFTTTSAYSIGEAWVRGYRYGTFTSATVGIYATINPLVDSYSESNQEYDKAMASLHPSVGSYESVVGQSFTSDNTQKLTSCKFYLKKIGSPTGNAVAKLYAHSGTYGTNSIPTGAALATSDNFDVSTLTTSYQLVEFTVTGSEQYEMQSSTKYCIAFQNPTTGTINWDNRILIGVDNSSPTHDGNSFMYDGSGWADWVSFDTCFYVYGESNPTGSALVERTVLWADLAGTITQPTKFKFTTPYALSDATVYALVMKVTGGDSSNYFKWAYSSNTPKYTGGDKGVSTDSGSTWSMDGTNIFLFAVGIYRDKDEYMIQSMEARFYGYGDGNDEQGLAWKYTAAVPTWDVLTSSAAWGDYFDITMGDSSPLRRSTNTYTTCDATGTTGSIFEDQYIYQSFTPTGTGFTGNYVAVKIYKSGSPNNLIIDLYTTDSNGDPNTLMDSVTVDAANVSTDSNGAWVVAKFDDGDSLIVDNNYGILLRQESDGGAAANRYVWIGEINAGTTDYMYAKETMDGGTTYNDWGGDDDNALAFSMCDKTINWDDLRCIAKGDGEATHDSMYIQHNDVSKGNTSYIGAIDIRVTYIIISTGETFEKNLSTIIGLKDTAPKLKPEKIISDQLGLVESYDLKTALLKTDIVGLVETVYKTTYLAPITDKIGLLQSDPDLAAKKTKTITDIVGLLQTDPEFKAAKLLTDKIGLLQSDPFFTTSLALSDLVGLAENITELKTALLKTDSIGVLESIEHQANKIIIDYVGLLESIDTLQNKQSSDQVGLLESISKLTDKGTISDQVGLKETNPVVEATKTKDISEIIGLLENLTEFKISILKTDLIGLLETISKKMDKETISDQIGLKESDPVTEAKKSKQISDSIGLLESIEYKVAIVLSEFVGLLESTPEFKASKVLTDKLGLLESEDHAIVYRITLTDIIGLLEHIEEFKTSKVFSDKIGLLETLEFKTSLVLTEIIGLLESIDLKTALLKKDYIGLKELITKTTSLDLSDILGLTESLSILVAIVLKEYLGLTESEELQPNKVLVDKLGLVESVVLQSHLFLSEIIELKESIQKLTDLQLTDIVGLLAGDPLVEITGLEPVYYEKELSTIIGLVETIIKQPDIMLTDKIDLLESVMPRIKQIKQHIMKATKYAEELRAAKYSNIIKDSKKDDEIQTGG